MSETPLLGLPVMEAAQAQKHVTHNEALLLLDAHIHLSVITRGLASPPVAPLDGDRYLLPAAPTGAWAGHAGQLAFRQSGGWVFGTPKKGWRLWAEDEAKFLLFDGSAWRDLQSGGGTADFHPTRAALVTAVGSGTVRADGVISFAAGLSYRWQAGASELPGLPGLVPAGEACLRHFGAAGDGVTNDMAALAAARGRPYRVSGEQLTYGVSGKLSLTAGTWWENATLKQLSPAASQSVVTLEAVNVSNLRLVNIKVNRNGSGANAGANAGPNGAITTAFGAYISGGTGHHIENLEVWGNDSGTGLFLGNLDGTSRVIRPYVHDIFGVLPAFTASPRVGDDQVQGIWVSLCTGLKVIEPRVERIGWKKAIGDPVSYLFCRAIPLNGCRGVELVRPYVELSDQGVDCTGDANGGNWGCVIDRPVVKACSTYGVKLANLQKRNRVVAGYAEYCGWAGFLDQASFQTVEFKSQTANFAPGEVITGAVSGSSGTVFEMSDAGATGWLVLVNSNDIPWTDNEAIQVAGVTRALVNLPAGWVSPAITQKDENRFVSCMAYNCGNGAGTTGGFICLAQSRNTFVPAVFDGCIATDDRIPSQMPYGFYNEKPLGNAAWMRALNCRQEGASNQGFRGLTIRDLAGQSDALMASELRDAAGSAKTFRIDGSGQIAQGIAASSVVQAPYHQRADAPGVVGPRLLLHNRAALTTGSAAEIVGIAGPYDLADNRNAALRFELNAASGVDIVVMPHAAGSAKVERARFTAAGLQLTGTPTAPTPAAATNTTQIATTAYVRTEVANAELFSQSLGAQGPGFAADTYLTGSNIAIPAGLKTGTRYRCLIAVAKTAAGLAAPVITLRFGAAASLADAALVALTFSAQTANADDGIFEVAATFRSVGAGTAAVVAAACRLNHTGNNVGLASNVSPVKAGTSAGFDSTLAGAQIGVSVNGGASAAWTISLVQATLENLN